MIINIGVGLMTNLKSKNTPSHGGGGGGGGGGSSDSSVG